MTDVCLVLMPYAAIERPSLALGLLKASLKENGIEPTVLYPNLWFTEDIGIYNYKVISEGLAAQFVGEWTFSGVAFPNFEPDHSDYFSIIPNLKEETIKELWRVREKAVAFVDRVAQSILELQPRIVSCSSTFHQHCASLALLRRIRELAPEIITIIGGANCEGVMGLATHQAFPWVDFVCSGEGDEIFAQLCGKILEQGQDLDLTELPYGVIGSAHRNQECTAALAPRASVQELDQVAIPDYDDYFETLKNSPKVAPYITPGMFVETSRGCWWGQKQHCTFCGLNGAGMTYRSKSPERVMKEFSWLSERYGQRKFFVIDNILDLKHIDTVLPRFAALEEPYSIFYETKANLKRQQVQQLAAAGVRWLQPGIESLHDSLLALMKKGNTALMNIQLLKWARECGIQVFWNFLVGLPGECGEWYAEMLAWLPLIAHLQPPTEETRQVRFDRFSPYYERSQEYGLTLVPLRTYSYIYPLDAERLQNLAYSFEEVGEERKIPEHQRLKEWVNEWQRLFKSESPPKLSVVVDSGNDMKLIDTRPCATEQEISIEGLAYQVYGECDRTLTYRELLNALNKKYRYEASWEEIQLVVEELRERRILLKLNGRLLSLAVSRAMLEFRLGNSLSTVDLSIFVDRRTLDLPDTLLTHPVWQSLQNFCREWVEPQSLLYRGLRLTGLEFDLGELLTQVPIPSIFVAWHREIVTDDQVLAEIVPKLPNYPVSSILEAQLQQCVNCLPQGATLESIGVMLSRPAQFVRVIVADIPLNQVLEYLMQIGWSEPSNEFSQLILNLSEFGKEVRLLSFDVGEKISPRVGLEFYPKSFLMDKSLWQLFLNHLVVMGLCTPTKKDALLAWPGFTQKADRPELWPSNLLAGDFLRGSTALSLFWRAINHVKIVYQPDTPLEAKGYLTFGHNWFDVNPCVTDSLSK